MSASRSEDDFSDSPDSLLSRKSLQEASLR